MATPTARRHATDTEVFDVALRTYALHRHLRHEKATAATTAWAMLYAAIDTDAVGTAHMACLH